MSNAFYDAFNLPELNGFKNALERAIEQKHRSGQASNAFYDTCSLSELNGIENAVGRAIEQKRGCEQANNPLYNTGSLGSYSIEIPLKRATKKKRVAKNNAEAVDPRDIVINLSCRSCL
jgi:hypothetical protein